MMDLNELLVFSKVAEARSFTLAAARLGMSKSTVSMRVAKLEHRLGVRLLHRTTRKFKLTEEGSIFHEHCRKVIEDIAEAERSITQVPDSPRGQVKLTAPVEFGLSFLGGWISEYLQRYPQMSIEVELTNKLVDIVEEGFDLAIRAAQLTASSQVARKLGSLSRGLYASPRYLKRRGTPRSVESLQQHTCLFHQSQRGPHGWSLLGLEGSALTKFAHPLAANSFGLLRDAALNDLGIVLTPDFICREAVRDKRLVRVLPDCLLPRADIFVVYPTRRWVAPRVRSFLSFIETKIKKLEREEVS